MLNRVQSEDALCTQPLHPVRKMKTVKPPIPLTKVVMAIFIPFTTLVIKLAFGQTASTRQLYRSKYTLLTCPILSSSYSSGRSLYSLVEP